MTAAESGALGALLTFILGAMTWIATTRNTGRTITANEEQAWAARLHEEIEYLSEQLNNCRREYDRLRGVMWERRGAHGDRLIGETLEHFDTRRGGGRAW